MTGWAGIRLLLLLGSFDGLSTRDVPDSVPVFQVLLPLVFGGCVPSGSEPVAHQIPRFFRHFAVGVDVQLSSW